jgi:hypothetical protein
MEGIYIINKFFWQQSCRFQLRRSCWYHNMQANGKYKSCHCQERCKWAFEWHLLKTNCNEIGNEHNRPHIENMYSHSSRGLWLRITLSATHITCCFSIKNKNTVRNISENSYLNLLKNSNNTLTEIQHNSNHVTSLTCSHAYYVNISQ